MDLELGGKVAIVTGGSRGIGRAICLAFGRERCNVALCARGEERLRETEQELLALGVQVVAEPVDVTRPGAVESFVEEVAHRLGRVDALVNNTGGVGRRSDDAAWQQAIDLNLMAAVRASRAAVPHLRGAGAIVNITSLFGREAGGPTIYNVVKSALTSLAKGLSRELAPEGIRVNSVAPGPILFPGGTWDHQLRADPQGVEQFMRDVPWCRFGTPEEVADVVVFLCSPRASWVTGAAIPVDGGQSRSNI